MVAGSGRVTGRVLEEESDGDDDGRHDLGPGGALDQQLLRVVHDPPLVWQRRNFRVVARAVFLLLLLFPAAFAF